MGIIRQLGNFKYYSDPPKVEFSQPIPDKLYKYCNLDTYKIEQLKENYLYFSHPNQLNDVLDGNPNLWDFSKVDFKEYKKLYVEILKIFNVLIVPNDITLRKCYEIEKSNNFFWTKYSLSLISSNSTGIYSLSANENNNLLWAHYSKDSGFVVEMNVEKLTKDLWLHNKIKGLCLYPILYEKKISPIKFIDNYEFVHWQTGVRKIKFYFDFMVPILYSFSLKSHTWKDENEWRIFIQKDKMGYVKNHVDLNITDGLREKILKQETKKKDIYKNNRKMKIERNSISKIILGPNFFSNEHFSDITKDLSGLIVYSFVQKKDNLAKQLLYILNEKDYSNKIFQLDINSKTFKREISYKIEIKEINDFCVKINQINFKK